MTDLTIDGHAMLTASARRVTPLNMTEGQVHWPDIAAALAKINRFNGCTSIPWSVAQHSVLVASLLPPAIRLHGLLHDAHEAYMGDITRPVKQLIGLGFGGQNPLNVLEEIIDEAIYRAAGLVWPMAPSIAEAVRKADDSMLAAELAQLFPDGRETRRAIAELGCDPAPVRIRPMSWTDAADLFTEELRIALDQHRAQVA